MKVLHYIPNFSVTTETFIYDQVLSIQEQGIESAVLTAKRLNISSRPFSKVYLAPFKTILNERLTQSLVLRFQLMPLFIDYKQWQNVLNEFKPDIIHCHTGNAVKTWMHVSDKLKVNIPVIASMHGSDVNSEPLVRKQYKKVLTSAASADYVHWTVPSNFLKHKLALNLSVPSEKTHVVYNAINPIFTQVKTPCTFEQIKVISVGRFITCKGHEFLIRGFAAVLKIYPDSLLTLVGSGPLKASMIELADALGIGKHVTFLDAVNHEELPSLLSDHNIYVQPSVIDEVTQQEESFGVAALEAMATGLSIVVTKCGGLKELAAFCNKDAVSVVGQKNDHEIAAAIETHFSQKARVSSQSREAIAGIFSNNKNAASINELYKRAI
jgi:glycosyltransferase involved in cell wall biosynthesis